MDFEQADVKYTTFFGADHREQSCRPSSAMLLTIVGSAADHRQHQEKLSRKLLESLVFYFDSSNIRYKSIISLENLKISLFISLDFSIFSLIISLENLIFRHIICLDFSIFISLLV